MIFYTRVGRYYSDAKDVKQRINILEHVNEYFITTEKIQTRVY